MRRLAIILLALCTPAACAEPALPLPSTLERASAGVAALLEQFSEVKCTEYVTQAKLSKEGKPEYSEDSRYDYLVMIQASPDELLFNESRLEEQKPRHRKNVPLLLTNGFSTMFLIFHPYYMRGFDFQQVGESVIGGRRVIEFAFRHIRGTRTPTLLLLRERQYPLGLAGTAWVDAASGALVKIRAGLDSDLSDVGLKSFTTEVEYAPIHLRGMKQQAWLPQVATIEVETVKQRWRNLHRFTNYKAFSVSVEETTAGVGK